MRDIVPTLSVKFMTVNTVKLFSRTLACAYSVIGVLCGNVVYKTPGHFYLFYDFPYGRILTLFVRYMGTLNIANSHTQN